MKLVPLVLDPMLVPPTAEVYQRMVLPAELLLRLAPPAAQIVVGEALITEGFTGRAFTVTGIALVEKTFPFALTLQVIV